MSVGGVSRGAVRWGGRVRNALLKSAEESPHPPRRRLGHHCALRRRREKDEEEEGLACIIRSQFQSNAVGAHPPPSSERTHGSTRRLTVLKLRNHRLGLDSQAGASSSSVAKLQRAAHEFSERRSAGLYPPRRTAARGRPGMEWTQTSSDRFLPPTVCLPLSIYLLERWTLLN